MLVGVVVVIEMPSVSRFEVVGAYQCCLIDGVGSLLLQVCMMTTRKRLSQERAVALIRK